MLDPTSLLAWIQGACLRALPADYAAGEEQADEAPREPEPSPEPDPAESEDDALTARVLADVEETHGRPWSDRPRFVYFLRRASDGAIKIGCSAWPYQRRSAMSVAHNCAVELLAQAPGSFRDEQIAHARFVKSRIDGEWFKPSKRLLGYVERVTRTGRL